MSPDRRHRIAGGAIATLALVALGFSGPALAADADTPKASAGKPGPGPGFVREVVTFTQALSFGDGATRTPVCPVGLEPVSGGAQSGTTATDIGQSYPNAALNGWTTSVENNFPATIDITWYSVCETAA